jgi:hypothetical protein
MVNHHRHPDPLHTHFNHDGEELDGRLIKALTTTTIREMGDIPDPTLFTLDYAIERLVNATSSTEHRSNIPVETLAKRWGTTINVAKQTIQQTYQRGLRYLEGPLSRRFRTRQKKLDRKYLRTKMYTDTMFKEHPSARGNTCMQIFVTAEGFVTGEPMKTKSDAYISLDRVCRNFGVPQLLVSDNAKEETLGNWGRITKQYLIK